VAHWTLTIHNLPSPILFIEDHPKAHHFGFLGMIIKASKFFKQAEFFGSPVIFQMLDKILATQK